MRLTRRYRWWMALVLLWGHGLSANDEMPPNNYLLEKVRDLHKARGTKSACQNDADALNNEAIRLVNKNAVDKAIETFTKSIEKCRKNPTAFANRGALRLQTKKWDAAIADLEEALKLEPSLDKAIAPALGRAYQERGKASADKGRHEAAIDDLRRSTTFLPNDAATHAHIARIYARQNMYHECVAFSSRAIALDSRLADAWTNRGACRSGLGELKKALVDINKAIELKPSAEAYMQRAALLGAQNDCASAVRDADQAVRMNPSLKTVRGDFLGSCGRKPASPPVIR